ncbi:MAG: adenylate/guanylate cyclase domain-containing protein [Stappiaceae bacterium]
MTKSARDPSPRSYAQGVYLVDRSNRGPSCAPSQQDLDDVHSWLLHDATRIDNVMLMFEEFMWRSKAAGLSIDRATLHVGTLHPRVIGFSWVWNSQDMLCDEIAADASAVNSDSFTKNPLYKVMREGQTIKVDLETEEGINSAPFMKELAEQGYTTYFAMPLSAAGEIRNAMTLATMRPGGFPPVDKERIGDLINLLALHVERHIVRRIARNVADTYLGPMAGRRVLDGEIRRGDGEAINAVVLMADMRGFTQLADRLSGPEVTSILNAYFDAISTAVLEHGGDILKFMGDGILAVFNQEALGATASANAAVNASRAALAAIRDLNENPPDDLPALEHWHPLKIGIALHRGEVFFGNVGGMERLDFTVIGRAVNETSRVESLCKPLGEELLITAPVQEDLSSDLKSGLNSVGEHALRGVGNAVTIFAA